MTRTLNQPGSPPATAPDATGSAPRAAARTRGRAAGAGELQFLIGFLLAAAACLLLVVATAGATEASPSPSATHPTGYIPEPEGIGTAIPLPDISDPPLPPPYVDVTNRQWALNWRAFGLRYRPSLVRLCRATGAHPLPVWYPRRAPYLTWREYGNACKAWALAVYRRERSLHYQVTHPGGSGAARWLPLAYYVGWPRSQAENLERCIRLESGGNPRATNGVCDGLLQIHRCHGVANPFNPEVNLRAGLRLWRAQGWAPWTTMVGR